MLARLVENRRLTAADHTQDVRHLAFDLGQSGLRYEPGDALTIVPQQPQAAVDAFLARLGLPAGAHVRVQLSEPPANTTDDSHVQPSFQVQLVPDCSPIGSGKS